MAFRYKFRHRIWEDFNYFMGSRFYSSKVDWNKLRPVILKRIEDRANEYPLKSVAIRVIRDRALLFEGVSTLLKYVPIKACKFCPEVYIGEKGHLIETCPGYRRRRVKNQVQVHEWIDGSLNDILVSVEAFHVHRLQNIIKHDNRFDFDRIPAVLELCSQAGANIFDQSLHSVGNDSGVAEMPVSEHDLTDVAIRTLRAWENLREGVQRLLLVYPAKVCKHCSEVHIGRSGHKARLGGVFKCETWRGAHFWKRAEVDNLVPPKIVWHLRNQDPPILLNKGRDFYGHAPAVVDLCVQAGAPTPVKYFCMMKVNGLTPPI